MDKIAFEKLAEYSLESLENLRIIFRNSRKKLEGIWKILDSYDSGDFWETMRKELPKHQIIPDTNHINYIKENIINSVYAAPYIADVLPMDSDDLEEARNINKFVEYYYNLKKVGLKQLKVSGRTALLNVGFIQGGWDSTINYSHLSGDQAGGLDLIVRDPMSVYLDPNFVEFQEGRAVFISTEESVETLLANYPDSASELKKYFGVNKNSPAIEVSGVASSEDVGKNYPANNVTRDTIGMMPVWIAFKKVPTSPDSYRIDQIIYTQGEIILEYKKGIKPNYFPLVGLYLTPPEKDSFGIGICQRVLKNVLSLNILNSIAITHTYAAQRTPWVFDTNSGLSVRRVQQDLNRPDVLFPISSGDATKVLHRLEYPVLPPNLEFIKKTLEDDIEKISGIDAKYTGRDTASVTTTGGMERLQQRVSMSDNTRISLIEDYAVNLTKMIIDFHIINGGSYQFVPTNSNAPKEKEVLSVDFGKYRNQAHKFLFSINAGPLMPKTRSRLAEAANIIMQTQMQYAQGGQQVQLMSAEEWLFFQDFPQKDMILDRMKIEQLRNDQEEIASELTSFSAMTEEGMRPESAVDQLAKERQLRRDPAVRKNILNKQQ